MSCRQVESLDIHGQSLPKVCPFLVTVDLKLKWPELPSGPNYPALPYYIRRMKLSAHAQLFNAYHRVVVEFELNTGKVVLYTYSPTNKQRDMQTYAQLFNADSGDKDASYKYIHSGPTWRRCALDLCDNGVASRSLVTWLLATKGMLSSSEVRFRRQGRKFLPMEGQSEGSILYTPNSVWIVLKSWTE